MNIHRLKMLAANGALMFNEAPAENEGGSVTPAPQEGAGEQEEQEQETPKPAHPWDDPEVAKSEIERLRQESAGRRVRERELEAQLKDAKSQEDIDKAVAEFVEKNAKLERENLVLQHGANLPETLRKYVQGDTEDEIKASIAELSATIPAPKTPPSKVGGGLAPGTDAPITDPGKLAELVRKNSRFPRV